MYLPVYSSAVGLRNDSSLVTFRNFVSKKTIKNISFLKLFHSLKGRGEGIH